MGTVRAQVAPAATRSGLSLSAGGEASAFQPDYADGATAQTSPNRIYGIGAYVDMRFTRWVQIEAEGRWSRFNQYELDGQKNGEDTYQVGPRIPIHTYWGLTPYGKFLFGLGGGSFLGGHSTVLTYGGGVDYRLSKRFTLRAFDFEYQDWRVDPTHLSPYGGSVGLSYKIF